MKKTMSKITIMAVAAFTTITSMVSISASANDGMTKEQAEAAAEIYAEPVDGYDIITDGYFTNPVDSIETATETPEVPETTEAPVTTEAPETSKIFAQGNWYVSGMDGIVNFFFNADSATGTRTNETTGFSENFTYDFDGNKIVMYYGSYSVTGYVSYSGYDIIISWESGFSDTLSTVHPSANVDPVVTTITTENKYNKPMLAHGTWYVTNTAGSKKYCFDIIEPIGCMYDFDGSAREFEYTIDGADLEFHIIGAARGSHAVVNYNADGTFSLSWADGTFEVLSQTEPKTATAPAVTTPAATTTVKATEVKKTTNTTATQAVTTTATQAVKKAPASTDSPKTGDKFPVIALTIAAVAAGTAGIVSSKKFSKK